LQSVLSQISLPDEIIVVDDGSTDGGGEIVKSIDAPCLRLIRRENQRVSAARNRGIAKATGDLIAFLEADDAWKPCFLEVIPRLRGKYPQAGAYATAYLIIIEDNGEHIPTFSVFTQEMREGLIPNAIIAVGRQFS
jgi:glycosyltransferase involved in cell wall biosynthesis